MIEVAKYYFDTNDGYTVCTVESIEEPSKLLMQDELVVSEADPR